MEERNKNPNFNHFSYEAIVLILIFNYLDGLDSPVP